MKMRHSMYMFKRIPLLLFIYIPGTKSTELSFKRNYVASGGGAGGDSVINYRAISVAVGQSFKKMLKIDYVIKLNNIRFYAKKQQHSSQQITGSRFDKANS